MRVTTVSLESTPGAKVAVWFSSAKKPRRSTTGVQAVKEADPIRTAHVKSILADISSILLHDHNMACVRFLNPFTQST